MSDSYFLVIWNRLRKKSASGFTLFELVLVLIVLGVIAAFAARPVAQTLEVWLGTMRTETDRAELNFALERMTRDVRWGENVISCGSDDLKVKTIEKGQPYIYSVEDGAITVNSEILASSEGATMSFKCVAVGSFYTLEVSIEDYTTETNAYCRNCDGS